MKTSISWVITPCGPLEVNRHSEGTCGLDPEDGGHMFLPRVSSLATDHTVCITTAVRTSKPAHGISTHTHILPCVLSSDFTQQSPSALRQ
jgi:hypothetical protein